MRKPLDVLPALAAVSLAAALAIADGPSIAAAPQGAYVGKTKAEIVKNLKKRGYSVREFEREGRLLEVEAVHDGVRYEIHVDPTTGKVVTVEEDD